jgi:hypothetical protein
MPTTKPLPLLLTMSLALACNSEPAPETAPKSARKPADTAPVTTPAPAEAEPLSGVGPSGAEGRAARRQAALDLLTDGDDASLLPIYATDPGEDFNPRLAEELAPKVWVSERPSPGSGSFAAQIKYNVVKIEGGLDRDIIRRIARAHINEVRSCYNAGLSKNRKLAGRVTINFVIAGTGKVPVATPIDRTLSDSTVENCIAKAIKRWTFPKPRGGDKVIVDFAFDLAPG